MWRNSAHFAPKDEAPKTTGSNAPPVHSLHTSPQPKAKKLDLSIMIGNINGPERVVQVFHALISATEVGRGRDSVEVLLELAFPSTESSSTVRSRGKD